MRRAWSWLGLLVFATGCIAVPLPQASPDTDAGTSQSATESATGEPTTVDSEICTAYLECLDAVDRELYDAARVLYGPQGSCFAIEGQSLCETQCHNGLEAMSLLHSDEPACGGDDGTSSTGPHPTTSGSTTSDGSTSTGATTGPETTGIPDDGEDGSPCSQHADCDSNACFTLGVLGGTCGQCLSDADCAYGCMYPDALSDPPSGSYCHQGQLGGNCESAGACAGDSTCALVLDVPGIITVQTCSECEADVECPGYQLCSVDMDVPALRGHRACVDLGSVPDGSTCDWEGSGDDACASGHCNVVDVQGLLAVGVCGQCDTDNDCNGGLGECIPASVDLKTGPTGSVCQY